MEDTVSTGSTTGPATFAEASWSEDSSPSHPSQTDIAAAPPSADATVPPAPTATDGSTPAGEPPKERWADILENARTKAREETESQWKQYEWAKQVNQSDLNEAIRIAQLAKADPITYLQDFIKELQTHPTYGQQLKSLAARALSQRSQSAEPQLEMIPVDLGDGRIVQLATAESQQKREAWLRQQMLAEAEQKFQPFIQEVEQTKAERAALARQQQIDQFVTTTEADVKTWPLMEDESNRRLMADELAKLQIPDDDAREIQLAVNRIYRTHILPKLQSKSESSLLDNLQRKAAAATTVNPGSAASTSPRSYSKFSDLPPDAWR